MDKYLLLYASNIPVRGKESSAIYCLGSGQIIPIPNSMYDVLQQMREMPLRAIKSHYAAEVTILNDYVALIIDHDLGFFTEDPGHFPPLVRQYYAPGLIRAAVVEYRAGAYPILPALRAIAELGCQCLEIRLPVAADATLAVELMEGIKECSIRSIDLLLAHHPGLDQAFYAKLYDSYPKIANILVAGSPNQCNAGAVKKGIGFTAESYQSMVSTQRYDPRELYVSISYFMEALHYNPYFHQKVAIDAAGNVKNCLLHQRSFGNLNTHSLGELIQGNAFRAMWYVNADHIEVIKDSPLRYALLITDELVRNEQGLYRTAHTSLSHRALVKLVE